MPSPNHMAAFSTKAEISAYDFSTWPNGTPIACLENQSWYFLNTTSTATADGENILTSASGRFFKSGGGSSGGGISVVSAKPTTAPTAIGETLIVGLDVGDTDLERYITYLSMGTSSVDDWKIMSGSTINANDTPPYYEIFEPDFVGQQWNDNYTPGFYFGADHGNGLIWINNITGNEVTTLG